LIHGYREFRSRRLQDAEKQCRAEIEDLERLSQNLDDQSDLLDPALEMLAEIRTAAPLARRASDRDGAQRELRAAAVAYVGLMKMLSREVGDGDRFTTVIERYLD
jgi:hypothetical protein